MSNTASFDMGQWTKSTYHRYRIDLTSRSVQHEHNPCDDLEDALGGIARAFKILDNQLVSDPYDPAAPLVMNIGLLSGTRVMTGLRTFFTGYSPLKTSISGAPGMMWSSGSGRFGSKLRGLGIDDVVFSGRCERPTMLRITLEESENGEGNSVRFEFLDASDLLGLPVNARIQELHRRYPQAHFAVIGPAGEQFRAVRYASIALSTDNQLESGHAKSRFCGRGGFGGVLGSKNLIAIVADGPNPEVVVRGLKQVNREINLGDGSHPYREDGAGGTWRMVKVMNEVGALPELNFTSTGTDAAQNLERGNVEAGPYVIKAEGCYLCGIRCHKNVHEQDSTGEAGTFRVKLDYEPLTLLSTNLGIYSPDEALTLVELVDEMCMDSISVGVTLGYAMEYNRRGEGPPLAGGLSFGDFGATYQAVEDIAAGRLPELGQGVMRLASQTSQPGYAMHSKGVEYAAFLPQTNPGYPWALASGHMSMRTYTFLLVDRDTDLDYWVDAITNRGFLIMLDDIVGTCKFAFVGPDVIAESLRIAAGIGVGSDDLIAAVHRTYLRGFANERRNGFVKADYSMPADAFRPLPNLRLPYFVTEEFFEELRDRVLAVLDERAAAEGFLP